ncbi:MAG: hypothetical protein V4544_01450 [Pseudomonadota bacterium]
MKVFNVLRRWLLVLVCSVGSVCAMEKKVYMPDGTDVYECSHNVLTVDARLVEDGLFDEKKEGLFPAISERVNVIAEEIAGNVDKLTTQIRHQPDGINYFICMGDTKVGKSSFISALIRKYGVDLNIVPEIGSSFKSCTKNVELFKLHLPTSTGLASVVIADGSGSRDSGGWEQDLANILSMTPISEISSVHFLVFVTEANAEAPAIGLADALRQLGGRFPGIVINPNSCFTLVLTKGSADFNCERYFGELLPEASGLSYFKESGTMELLNKIGDKPDERILKFPRFSRVGEQDLYIQEAFAKRFGTADFGRFLYNFAVIPEINQGLRDLVRICHEEFSDNIRNEVPAKIGTRLFSLIEHARNSKSHTSAQLIDSFARVSNSLRNVDENDFVESVKNSLVPLGKLGDLDADTLFMNTYNSLFTLLRHLKVPIEIPSISGALGPLTDMFDKLANTETKVINVEWVDTERKRVGSNNGKLVFDRKKNRRWWVGGPILTNKETLSTTFNLTNGSIEISEIKNGNGEFVRDCIVGEHSNRRFAGRECNKYTYTPPKSWDNLVREFEIDSGWVENY